MPSINYDMKASFIMDKGKTMKKWSIKTIIVAIMVCCSVMAVSALVYTAVSTPDHVIENNGYYADTGKFDKEMTPVSNMLLLLKIINGSNYCDDDWYTEVKELQTLLNKQIQQNSYSSDSYTRKMMELQQNIEKKLRSFSTKAWVTTLSERDVNELESAYNAYHDYYYQHYGTKEEI